MCSAEGAFRDLSTTKGAKVRYPNICDLSGLLRIPSLLAPQKKRPDEGQGMDDLMDWSSSLDSPVGCAIHCRIVRFLRILLYQAAAPPVGWRPGKCAIRRERWGGMCGSEIGMVIRDRSFSWDVILRDSLRFDSVSVK